MGISCRQHGDPCHPCPCRSAAAGTPSLKDVFKDIFLIGTALDFRSANEFNPAELDLIKSQFNVITPENSMKPGPVHPQENSWNWTQPEALVDFCRDNNLKTMGHCLVWHSQTNPWFFEGANRELALARGSGTTSTRSSAISKAGSRVGMS